MYGLLESKPFASYIEAERRTGNSGDIVLELLESRFDNAVYRLGLAPTRAAARQLVTHGHFMLSGRRVDIPSIKLRPGDEFAIRPKAPKILTSSRFSKISRRLKRPSRPLAYIRPQEAQR